MKDGFVYSAFCLPDLKLCDTEANADAIIEKINILTEKKVALAVFPELSVTGYTAGDLFGQRTLIDGALDARFARVDLRRRTDRRGRQALQRRRRDFKRQSARRRAENVPAELCGILRSEELHARA